MLEAVIQVALAVIPAIIAITLHEAAHGYAALALGDDTAKKQGRISVNPLRHVDDVGTLILPGILILGQVLTIGRVAFLFGWAKPVPVDPYRFRDPRRGMMLVAAAGPAANFVLAWIGAVLLHGAVLVPNPAGDRLELFLTMFMLSNLVLGLFNLLPIPPLDGGRIMVGLLPERAALAYARVERAGILVVLAVVFLLPLGLSQVGINWNPVGHALERILPWAFDVVYGLAGL